MTDLLAILREALPEVVAILIVGILGLIYRQYLHGKLPRLEADNLARLATSLRRRFAGKAFWPTASALLLLAVVVAYISSIEGPITVRGPITNSELCDLEREQAVQIDEGPATAGDILSFFSSANPALFDRLEELERDYLAGEAHRGLTYIWGSPGVGKSFIVRNRLNEKFPGTSCLIKLGDLKELPPAVLGFETRFRPDLATVDGSRTFDTLLAIDQVHEYSLEKLFAGAECMRNGAAVPFTAVGEVDLILIDDIDEVHSETTNLVLRSLDQFVLTEANPENSFAHVAVFGRSEGFATWYWDPKRHEDIVDYLEIFNLRGPQYRTTGDIEVLAESQGLFKFGEQTWNRMKEDGSAAVWIAHFVDYISRHPVASSSIQTLAIATMVSDRAQAGLDDSEPDLMAYIFDELLRRAERVHGRPPSSDDEYLYLLEEIAVRYQDETDAQGFFHVGINDTARIAAEGGAQVSVRDALAHSGIAILDLPTSSIARYRFEPLWVHHYLLELRNLRSDPEHVMRACLG